MMAISTRRLGRYELVARIGAGALAEVHLARQEGATLPVAVKTVHPRLTATPGLIPALVEVGRLAAEVKHPNVVETFEVGEADGTCFLAMEYLPGVSLAALLKAPPRGVRLDRWSIAQILADAAAGLHAIHELRGPAGQPAGLLHHDVSPGNIFVLPTGVTKLVDVGVARARPDEAEARVLVGYVAPEVREGAPGDRRSDVFSLGVVMWEALTRNRLYGPGSDRERLARMRIGRVTPPSSVAADVGKALDEICVRALAKDPAARYPTAAAMHDDLIAALREAGRFGDHASIARFMRETFVGEIASREQLLRERGFDVAASGSIRRPTVPPFRSGSIEPPPFAALAPLPPRTSDVHAAVDGASAARGDSRIANAFAADLAEAIDLAPGEGLPEGDGDAVPELEADLEESAPHQVPPPTPVPHKPPPVPARTIMMGVPPAKPATVPPPVAGLPSAKPATIPPLAPARTLMMVQTPIEVRAAAAVPTPAIEPAPAPARAADTVSAPTLMISRTTTPTLTPIPTPSPTPSPIPTPNPTPNLSPSPSPIPTPSPSPSLSLTPTPSPSDAAPPSVGTVHPERSASASEREVERATIMLVPSPAAAESRTARAPSPIPMTRLASMTSPPAGADSGADDATAANTTGPVTPLSGPHPAAAATPWAPAPFDGEFDEEIEIDYGTESPPFALPPPQVAVNLPTTTAPPRGRGLIVGISAVALVAVVAILLWMRGRAVGSHDGKVADGPTAPAPGSLHSAGSGAALAPPGPGSAEPMIAAPPDAATVEPVVATPPDAAVAVVAVAIDAGVPEPAVAIDAGAVARVQPDAGPPVAANPGPPTPPKKPAGPTAVTLYKQGQASFMIGNNTTALQYFQSAVARDHTFALAHRGMGLIYDRMGDHTRAAKSYRAYLKLQPHAKDAALIKSRLDKLP